MRHARLAVMSSYILCLSLLLSACASEQDEERIPQLKKQTKSLQAKLEVRPQTEALDPQAKCATDGPVWFSVNWRRDKNTFLLDSSSHQVITASPLINVLFWSNTTRSSPRIMFRRRSQCMRFTRILTGRVSV